MKKQRVQLLRPMYDYPSGKCWLKAMLGFLLLAHGVLVAGRAESAGKSIQWGVNVHYGSMANDVVTGSLGEILLERNLTVVRLDLWGQDASQMDPFRNVASAMKARKIRVEANLFTPFSRGRKREHDTGANLKEVETLCYAQTKQSVERSMDVVQDYELQNEISLYPGIKRAGMTGQNASDYDTPVGRLQAAALRGMSRAIDDVRKTSKHPLRIILGTTDRSFGLLTFMREQGVLFDVVGYHIYPYEEHRPLDQDPWFGPGGPLGQLARFHKPIVIDEFNSGEIYSGAPGHPGIDYENEAGMPETEKGLRSLNKHLEEIIKQKVANVEAVLFYELCDEPAKEKPENHFGMYYDFLLQKPKVSLFLVTSFTGGKLSPAEQAELRKRGIGLLR